MSKKTLRTGVAAAMGGAVLLAGLIVGASIAFADDGSTSTDDAVPEKECRFEHLEGLLPFSGQLEDLAEDLGLDLEAIQDQLRDGASLDEIAESQGIDLGSVIEDLKQTALDEIDARVDAGDITEERANAIRERIEAFELDEFPRFEFRGRMPGGFDFDGFGDGRGFGGFFGDFDLDLDLSELRDQLESGVQLPDALEELGINTEDLLTDARTSALEHIDKMVEEGVITAERADEIREMIEGFDLDDGFPGFFRNGRGFKGHQHGQGFGFFGPGIDGAEAFFSA